VKRVPLVAIVGKPNVGKSTLFNRLVGRRTAIVDDQPGVTRDRLFGEARLAGQRFLVVDTGGVELRPDDKLLSRVREQTQLAIDEADLVLFVLDSDGGVTPADHEVAQMLRRSRKPTLVVANKVDTPRHEERLGAMYELGMEPIFPMSAEHGRGFSELVEAIYERIDAPEIEDVAPGEGPLATEPMPGEELEEGAPVSMIQWEGGPIRVAVVGRPNAGKSSLVNRLLGEERHLTGEKPGTTRDAIDSTLEHGDQTFVFTDTAGIRRKRSVIERLERFAVMMAMRGLEGADVALVVLDANETPSDQDSRIASLAIERGKGVILVANKWDLVKGEEAGKAFGQAVERQLGFAQFAPTLRVSARTGRGVEQLLERIVAVQRERHRRIGTGELNRFFKDVVEDTPPPIQHGRRPKLYFVQQPLIRPPTFIFTSSHGGDVRDSYARYLQNSLRKRYGFEGTPIWIKFRDR
jgi:GTP-binding protein